MTTTLNDIFDSLSNLEQLGNSINEKDLERINQLIKEVSSEAQYRSRISDNYISIISIIVDKTDMTLYDFEELENSLKEVKDALSTSTDKEALELVESLKLISTVLNLCHEKLEKKLVKYLIDVIES